MKKRMYFSMVLLTTLAVAAASMLLCFVFYRQIWAEAGRELRARTTPFVHDTTATLLPKLEHFPLQDLRLTLIREDGEILFDNTEPIFILKNHRERAEVRAATEGGSGESRRLSATSGQEMYYYAVRLADGAVLRVAKNTDSIRRIFVQVLPLAGGLLLLVIAVGYRVAVHITDKIVEPLIGVDLNEELFTHYDELAPFVKTIARQREKIARDFTELQNRIDTMNALTENMNEGIVMLDKGGTILSLNKSAGAIFGADKAMAGKNFRELSRNIALINTLKEAVAGNHSDMVFENAGRSYSVLASPVFETGVIIFFLDITEKSQAEKMRQEFSANVSHELKTPLTSIYGTAEMLHGGVVLEQDRPLFYKKIMDEATRLIALIEDIMMISELDEGRNHDHFEQVNLVAVARECAGALAQKAGSNEVTVAICGEGTLYAKRSMMYELFYNLIDNAVKYNKPGGRVDVQIEQGGGTTKIVVTDTGIGIPLTEQSRIFERFYRVDKSRSKKTGGTGLGLAIVKHIVQTHGGKIAVASTKGQGTKVEMVFERESTPQ